MIVIGSLASEVGQIDCIRNERVWVKPFAFTVLSFALAKPDALLLPRSILSIISISGGSCTWCIDSLRYDCRFGKFMAR